MLESLLRRHANRKARKAALAAQRRSRAPLLETLEERRLLAVDLEFALDTSGGGYDQGNAVVLDAQGDIFTSTRDSIRKYDGDGTLLWSKPIPNAEKLAVDAAGNIYATGRFYGRHTFEAGNLDSTLVSNGSSDDYVVKLDGAGNFLWGTRIGGYSSDAAGGIAVDAAGNVLVTGEFYYAATFGDPDDPAATLTAARWTDAYVAKLDAAGNFLWAKGVGGAGLDHGADVAADADGNVYVVGSFYGSYADFDPSGTTEAVRSANGYDDIFVLKLNADGDYQWVQTAGGFLSDQPEGIAVDAAGAVYAVGKYYGDIDFDRGVGVDRWSTNNRWDTVAWKLNADGTHAWAKGIRGDGDVYDVAMGGDGRLYMSGRYSNQTDLDPGPGTFLLNDPGLNDDDVFAAGWNADGTFAMGYAAGGVRGDSAVGIAADAAGNVFVTGTYSSGTADFDPGEAVVDLASYYSYSSSSFLIKLGQDAAAASGNLWQDIDQDGARDVGDPPLVGGAVELFLSTDAIVGNQDDRLVASLASDADGNYRFESLYRGANYYLRFTPPFASTPTASNAGDDALDSDADGSGLTELFTVGGSSNLVFDAGFILQDFFAFNVGSPDFDRGNAVTTDAAGDIYVTGHFRGEADFDPGPGETVLRPVGGDDAFVAKYTPDGRLLWARRVGGRYADEAEAIGVDGLGNVYVGGLFQDTVDFDPGVGEYPLTSQFLDAFVLKLDSEGDFVWAKSFTGSGYAYARGLAVRDNGEVYFTGTFSGVTDFDPGAGSYPLTNAGGQDVFVAKLSGDGQFRWAKRIGNYSNYDNATGVAVDGEGDVYLTGVFDGTLDMDPSDAYRSLHSHDRDGYLLKLDGEGNYLWSQQLASGLWYADEASGVAVDAAGNAYVTGTFSYNATIGAGTNNPLQLTGDSYNMYVLKFDGAGTPVWGRNAGTGGRLIPNDISVDDAGNVALTGQFLFTADFDPGAADYSLSSAGSADVFVSQLNGDGDFKAAYRFGGTRYDMGLGVALTADGTGVYATGSFDGEADPQGDGVFSLISVGGQDAFLWGLTSPPTELSVGMQGGSVVENSPAGTVAGRLIVRDNWANAPFGLELIDDAGGKFVLDGDQIEVAPGASLDYETQTSYTITVRATDSAGAELERDFTIEITNVDEAPVVTLSGQPPAFTENGAPVVVAPNLTLADDGDTLDGMLVAISAGFVAGEDVLAFTPQNGITGAYDAATGILALSGTATLAQYQQALRSVTYLNTSEAPSAAPRGVSFTAVQGMHWNPATGHFYEYVGASEPIDWASASAAADGRDLYGVQGYLATVTSEEENAFVASLIESNSWIGASDANAEGTWRWRTGPEAGTQFWQGRMANWGGSPVDGAYANWRSSEPNDFYPGEDYAAMTYPAYLGPRGSWFDQNESGGYGSYGVNGYVVEYGGLATDPNVPLVATTTVEVRAVNDAPEIDLNGPEQPGTDAAAHWVQNEGPVTVAPNLTVSDADAVAVAASADALYVLNYRQVLKVDLATRQTEVVATNGLLNHPQDIAIDADGDLLVADGWSIIRIDPETGEQTLVPRVGPQSWLYAITVDQQSGNIYAYGGGQIWEIDPTTGAQRQLGYFGPIANGGLTTTPDGKLLAGTYDGRLLLIDSATGADTQVAPTLGSLNYIYSWVQGVTIAPDGDAIVAAGNRVVRVDLATGAQTLVANGGELQQPHEVAVTSQGDILVADNFRGRLVRIDPLTGAQRSESILGGFDPYRGAELDSAELADSIESATVTITNLLNPGSEVLSVEGAGGDVTAQYDPATGVLTLTGAASPARYAQLLRSVKYHNYSFQADATPRAIEFAVNDGDADSLIARSTVTLDPDAATEIHFSNATLNYVENSVLLLVAPDLTLADSDSATLDGFVVRIGDGFDPAHDHLAYSGDVDLDVEYFAEQGVLFYSGTASLATYQAALRQVRFWTTGDAPATQPRAMSFQALPSTPDHIFANGPGARYNPLNGHFYRWVAAPNASWDQARAAAESQTALGRQGYLATVTDAQENAAVAATALGTTWLGATDEEVEGQWRWATGPEAGMLFWQGGPATGEAYTNWKWNEPNDSYPGEDYATLLQVQGAPTLAGRWNDIQASGYAPTIYDARGYVVEYGGQADEPLLDLPTATTPLTVTAVNDAPTIAATPGDATRAETNEDTPLILGGFRVADVDLAADPAAELQVVLSAAHGAISFASDTATVAVAGNDSQTVTLTGTPRQLNQALQSFTYHPLANYGGSDTLTLVVNDQGNIGVGGPLSDSCAVDITVHAVADPPQLSAGDVSGDEGAAIPLAVAAALNDLDGSEQLAVAIEGVPATASLSAGTLTGGVWMVDPDDLADLTITFGDNGDYTLAVVATATEASNGDAASVRADFLVTVANVAPRVEDLIGPNAGIAVQGDAFTAVRGQQVTLAGAFTDPGHLDTHEVAWDFGDGAAVDFQSSRNAGALNPAHVYTAAGVYTITLAVRDDDGAVTTQSAQIEVKAAELQRDALDPSQTALVVGGTLGDDHLVVHPGTDGWEAQLDGASLGAFQPNRIVVIAQAGDDDIQIAGSVSLPVWIYAGDGQDRVKGGAGHDVIFGGAGDDLLIGGGGRDFMLGERGADRLVGNADDDLLISGWTAYDANARAIQRIVEEWNSEADYESRVEQLRAGVASDDETYALDVDAVFDDGLEDVLTGSSGQDWFLLDENEDRVAGLDDEEFADDLAFIQSDVDD